jgi:glutamyl-tRNA synthetase
VGALRIALFNHAFAETNGGSFVIRVEDTDRTRLDLEYTDDLYSMLAWTGVEYHEGGLRGGPYGPYTQSQRADLYRTHAHHLVAARVAYFCFCSPGEIRAIREQQRSAGHPPRYDGRCAAIPLAEAWARVHRGDPHVVRMRIPGEAGARIHVHDAVHGKVGIPLSTLDDQILLKADGMPTYHFSSVVDDHLMHITHVIRADVWLVNTAKHLMLYDWFGWEPPRFAHVPPLSNGIFRTPVRELKDRGVPADAVVNFAAALGWRQHSGQEVFTLRDMTSAFALGQLRRSCGSADPARLEWLSGKHLRRQSHRRLAHAVVPFLTDLALPPDTLARRERAVAVFLPHCRTLRDLAGHIGRLVRPSELPPEVRELLAAHRTTLPAVVAALRSAPIGSAEEARRVLEGVAQEENVTARTVLDCVRWAVWGSRTSPDILALVALIGPAESADRIARALESQNV